MNIKISKIHADAVIPAYAYDGDSGFDFSTVEDLFLEGSETGVAKTGLKFEIPKGYELQIRPRSGVSLKTQLRVANSPGTIDSNYRGEIGIIIQNNNPIQSINIPKGMKIAQGVIVPVVQAKFTVIDETDLSTTERGENKHGSSGV
jgi:dUTP pyrophosphatase